MVKRYNTRYFNNIIEDKERNVLIKSSSDIQKIKDEYLFYYALPENLQRYFVQPFDFVSDDKEASYSMEKFNIRDAAFNMVSGQFDKKTFGDLLSRIAAFLDESGGDEVSSDEIEKASMKIFKNKLNKRMQELNDDENWALYKDKDKFDIPGLQSRILSAYSSYSVNRNTFIKKISHGDLCLSNILWDSNINLIKFIDPKGVKDIYLDEYYDMAKLSHSILGGYDSIVANHFKIDKDTFSLHISNHNDIMIQKVFKSFLKKRKIDLNLLRVYEAYLFVAMCPKHLDDTNRIAAFLLNADRILKEIGY